jgi:hypothetical protein
MSTLSRFATALCLLGACGYSSAQLQLLDHSKTGGTIGYNSQAPGQQALSTANVYPTIFPGTVANSFNGSFTAAAVLDTDGSGIFNYKTESIDSSVDWLAVFKVLGTGTQIFTLSSDDTRTLTLFSDGGNSYSSGSLYNNMYVSLNNHIKFVNSGPYAAIDCSTNALLGPGPCHNPTGSFVDQVQTFYRSLLVAPGDTIRIEGYADATVSSGAKAFSTAGGSAHVTTTWVASVAPVTPIPEPSTYAMMIAGLLAVVCAVRRRVPLHPKDRPNTSAVQAALDGG